MTRARAESCVRSHTQGVAALADAQGERTDTRAAVSLPCAVASEPHPPAFVGVVLTRRSIAPTRASVRPMLRSIARIRAGTRSTLACVRPTLRRVAATLKCVSATLASIARTPQCLRAMRLLDTRRWSRASRRCFEASRRRCRPSPRCKSSVHIMVVRIATMPRSVAPMPRSVLPMPRSVAPMLASVAIMHRSVVAKRARIARMHLGTRRDKHSARINWRLVW